MINELVAFLEQRLLQEAEDARVIHYDRCHFIEPYYATGDCDCGVPDDILAQVTSRRRILDRLAPALAVAAVIEAADGYPAIPARFLLPVHVVRLMAMPYAKHASYDQAWTL